MASPFLFNPGGPTHEPTTTSATFEEKIGKLFVASIKANNDAFTKFRSSISECQRILANDTFSNDPPISNCVSNFDDNTLPTSLSTTTTTPTYHCCNNETTLPPRTSNKQNNYEPSINYSVPIHDKSSISLKPRHNTQTDFPMTIQHQKLQNNVKSNHSATDISNNKPIKHQTNFLFASKKDNVSHISSVSIKKTNVKFSFPSYLNTYYIRFSLIKVLYLFRKFDFHVFITPVHPNDEAPL